MKKKYLLLLSLALLFFNHFSYAQDVQSIFTIWVGLKKDTAKIKGYLYEVKDSTIIISKAPFVQNNRPTDLGNITLHIEDIHEIKIREKNKKSNGILTGALAGIIIGGTIGLLLGSDPPCNPNAVFGPCIQLDGSDKAFLIGSLLGGVGAGIGVLIGSIKVTIPINGSKKNYAKKKDELKKYLIQR